MELEELKNLPEGIGRRDVERLCDIVLHDSEEESIQDVLEKFGILGDKQWHTYEMAGDDLRGKIEKWLNCHWDDSSQYFLRMALSIAFRFGLDKELYKMALRSYTGELKDEYEKYLQNSAGDHIDPYWSLRSTGK